MAAALKKGGSSLKRQKGNDRHFVIIRLFGNLITLPTDVSTSCNLSECSTALLFIYLLGIFTYLKLYFADAIHNFKRVTIIHI